MTDIAEQMRSVLRAGDEQKVRFLRGRHVPRERLEEIADLTHRHAWQHGTDDAEKPGWRRYPGGILTWWVESADLDDEQRFRLHRFRSDVVDVLTGQGKAQRWHPQSSPLQVAPPSEQPTVGGTPHG